MKNLHQDPQIKIRLLATCKKRGTTIPKVCKKLKVGKSGLYKAMHEDRSTYAHFKKICKLLTIPEEWLVYGNKSLEPEWVQSMVPRPPAPAETAPASPAAPSRHARRRMTTIGDDDLAMRLEILERRYAVVADRFLSLAERAAQEGLFVSPREIDEVKDDLEDLI